MASVERRTARTRGGKPTYRVRYRDPAGEQRSRSFSTLALARAFQATVEADKLRGSYVDQSRGRMTLGEYADHWLSVQTFGPTTRERRTQSIRLHIKPFLGSVPLAAVRPNQIQAWVRELSQTLAPRTVHEIVRLLSSILKAAVEDERIVKNPCRSSSIRVPKPDDKPLEPWTTDQIAAMRAALPARYMPLMTLSTGLGMRQGEIFGLAVDDIDFLRRTVTIQRQVAIIAGKLVFALPKGRKVRSVPLPRSVGDELAAYLQAFPAREVSLPWGEPDGKAEAAQLVLTSRERRALNKNYVNSHVWRPALRAAGVSVTRENMMHGGRHFYASLQLEHGISPRALADYLGHADPAYMMRIYTHLMPEAAGKVGAAVDSMFDSLSAKVVQAEGR